MQACIKEQRVNLQHHFFNPQLLHLHSTSGGVCVDQQQQQGAVFTRPKERLDQGLKSCAIANGPHQTTDTL